MLFLHHTRMSATVKVLGEAVTTWSGLEPKFTWYHISQCISTAQEQPTASPKSHFLTMLSKLLPRTQGQSGLTGTSRDLGGSCRLHKLTSRGIKAALRAGKSAKACAGTGNKGRVGPFSHFTTVNDFKEQEQYCGHFLLILLGPAGPSSQDSHRSIAPMPVWWCRQPSASTPSWTWPPRTRICPPLPECQPRRSQLQNAQIKSCFKH